MLNADVLCIVMTYNRQHMLYHVVDQAYKQTVPCDIVIWNNSPKSYNDIPLFKEVQVFHGINSVGLHQRFIPALLYPHEYVMFIDDDLDIGEKFAENAIAVIEKNEKALVVSMGSVMQPPLNLYNVERRVPVVGSAVKNQEPWHLDLGSMGACVCRRKYIHSVFHNGFIPPHPAEEIAFSMMHKVLNNGTIMLAPHDQPEAMGIRAFQKEHYEGMTSSPSFFTKRVEIIQSLGHKFGWQPSALKAPEWQEGGAARRSINANR